MSFASISNLRTYSTQLAMPGTSVIVLLKDKMGAVGTKTLAKFDNAISSSKRTVQVRRVVGQVASASYAKISSIAGQAILRLDRSASSMGNVAKFFNLVFSTSNFAVKMFQGSHLAHLSGNFLKVKDINDLVSAFNAFDLLGKINNSYQKAWKKGGIELYRLAQTTLLFLGSSLAPISLASKKMDLFKLGYYGEDIGVVGKMPRLDFFKNVFILTASVMSLADKTFYPSTEGLEIEIAKLRMEQWDILKEWSENKIATPEAIIIYDHVSSKIKQCDKNAAVVDRSKLFAEYVRLELDEAGEAKVTLLERSAFLRKSVQAHAELERMLYEEKTLKLAKSTIGYKDDILKIVAISAVFAGAYWLSGLTDYTGFALVTFATGFYGAEKADIDTRVEKQQEDIKNSKKTNKEALSYSMA